MNIDQQQLLPSTDIAKKLILTLKLEQTNKPQYSISELLIMLKNKKNPNHEKFAGHIEKQLFQQKIQIFSLINMVIILGRKCNEVQNTDPQIKSISFGIKRYIQKCLSKQNILAKDRKKIIQQLIRNLFQFQQIFSLVMSEQLNKFIQKLSQKQQQLFQKQIHNLVIDSIKNKNPSPTCFKQCCGLIHHMNLYRYFRIQDLVHIARGTKSNNILYFFKDKKGNIMKQLVQSYVIKQKDNDQKSVIRLIQSLSLKVNDFPALMKQLCKKGLRFFMRQLEIYSLDLLLAERSDIAEVLVQILLDDNKLKQALHFINKHYLTKYYHLNPTQKRSYNKNILLDKDQFIPTQNILAKYYPKYKNQQNYLTIQQFGYEQKNIYFVNSQNINSDILDYILNSDKIGMDCQNRLAFNAYQKSNTQIWQIAICDKIFNQKIGKDEPVRFVYILDFNQLKNNQKFRVWFEEFCCGYKGKIVGHTVKRDFMDLITETGQKDLYEKAQKLKFIEVAEKFKQKYNQTKSSLEYMCSKIIGKSLSKFQQKSGWNNRPLRLAQLHYAALDAVLPLKIDQRL